MTMGEATATAAAREVPADGWDALLDRLGLDDVYLRHGYLQAAAVLEPSSRPVLLHVAGDAGSVVFPVLVREVPGGSRRSDVITPYGYGGPVAAGDAPSVEQFAQAYEAWCRERGVVSTFVRFHPLLQNHTLAPPSMELVPLSGTVSWRLDAGPDVRATMHRWHRNRVKKAEQAGVTASIVEAPADLDAFVALYELTMRRQHASDFYFFPGEHWQLLLDGLRDRLVLVNAMLDGEVVAASLYMRGGGWLHYHLGASADAARSVGASNFVMFSAAQWGQEQGLTRLHMGGGVGGGDDSLFAYKRRFDPGGVCEAYIGKQVNDLPAYSELAGTADTAGFFPAYRRPATSSR